MLKIIDSRKINGEYRDVYLTPDKKEVIKLGDNYYYLNKKGIKITTRIYLTN